MASGPSQPVHLGEPWVVFRLSQETIFARAELACEKGDLCAVSLPGISQFHHRRFSRTNYIPQDKKNQPGSSLF